MPKPTHQEVKSPKISARKLAEFMAGSDVRGRTIVIECKYRPIARIIQHNEAKAAISSFIRGEISLEDIKLKSTDLRNRYAESDFERNLYDHNADYIDRFLKVRARLAFPDAEILSPGKPPALELNKVRVTFDLAFRLERVTRTNKLKLGAAALRYQKGKALKDAEAEWHGALIHGYLARTSIDGDPEHQLCMTVDAYSGILHPAPTDAVSRFKNAEAACANIAERWEKIPPPKGAILEA